MAIHAHRSAITDANREALQADLRDGFGALRAHFIRLQGRLRREYDHGGLTQLQRTYRHWYTLDVVVPRYQLYQRGLARAVHRRATLLRHELTDRYGERFPFHEGTVARAMQQVWTQPRGRTRWAYAQMRMPTDAALQYRFLTILTDWMVRSRAAERALRAHRDDVTTPQIDPDRRRIEYPGDDATEPELVDEALDSIVVGRGQYYAEVGLRDIMREADRAVSLIESGQQAVIIGWRWVLSDAHEDKLCPSGICSALAEADVGHPHGPGVYFDALVPSEHPNGWCDLEAEWADEDEAADPDWEPPEPPDGYEDLVRAIYAEHGVTLLE